MKRTLVLTLTLVCLMFIPLMASAASIRAYIADFSVSPADSSDLKGTLKRLLSSRLAGDGLTTVETPADADVIVSGSYTSIGKMFSLDAFAKSAAGKQVASAFEQGDNLDQLIPAVGKISAKLKGDILKECQVAAAPAPTAPATATAAPAAPPVAVPAPALLPKAGASEIVRKEAVPGTTSQRIPGAQSALASWGTRDFLTAEEGGIHLYRQGEKLALIATAALPEQLKILGIDALPPDREGRVLAFVTIVDRENPSSMVYSVQGDSIKLLAKDLPYLFRVVAPYGGAKQLYAQQMGRTDDYYGDVHEATFADGGVKLGRALKMPRFGNIFNFNMFRDASGNSFLTAFSDGGYLLVYSDSGEEIWRSSDKFGGTETYFQRKDADERTTGTPFRTRFIDQRITVTEKGEILVPQNSGFFVLGNQRSYSKYSIVAFTWNGSTLEELWRTKQSQSYLPDYSYHPATRELVLLEVAQKRGFASKGGSTIRIMRAE